MPNSKDEPIFDEEGNILPMVHNEHHVFVHKIKSEAERKAEFMDDIKKSTVKSLILAGVLSVFSLVWWAFNQFVRNGGA